MLMGRLGFTGPFYFCLFVLNLITYLNSAQIQIGVIFLFMHGDSDEETSAFPKFTGNIYACIRLF